MVNKLIINLSNINNNINMLQEIMITEDQLEQLCLEWFQSIGQCIYALNYRLTTQGREPHA
jgi:hypothetical protein